MARAPMISKLMGMPNISRSLAWSPIPAFQIDDNPRKCALIIM
jgi:hypothetical protein